MNEQIFDPRWQQLQSRIDKFVGHFLRDSIPAIEYRSNIVGLLPSPMGNSEQGIKKAS
jgi:hypothetical protein